MKKNLNLLAAAAATLFATFSASAAIEVGFLDADALGLDNKPTLPGYTLLAETESAAMYLENEQECSAQNPVNNGMNQLIVNGETVNLVTGIGGNVNPSTVDIFSGPKPYGCQYHLTVKKNGWIIIPSKISSNKNYYVYEGNYAGSMKLMAYTLGMDIANSTYPSLTHGIYTLPTTESGYFDFNSTEVDNFTFGSSSIAWPIRILTHDAEAVSAGNGTGAIMFPVYAEAYDYYVFCTGSKMNTCGFIFVEGDPKGEAPSLTVKGSSKSFDITRVAPSVAPDPTPDPDPDPTPDPDPDPDPTPAPTNCEVGFINAEALGLPAKPTLTAYTLLAETENAAMYFVNEQECSSLSIAYNGMSQLIVNGENIDLVTGMSGTSNAHGNIISGPTDNYGCEYLVTVRKDGWIIVPSRIYSNKPYYVFEDNFSGNLSLMAYTLGMEIDNIDYSHLTHGVFTLPSTESGYFASDAPNVDNYTFGQTTLAWPIRIFTQNDEANTAGFGTGAIMFPVYADRNYYVFNNGAKMSTCGYIFVEGDPKGEAPSLTVYGPQRIMDGEVYPEKSFEIKREVSSVYPDPTPDPTPDPDPDPTPTPGNVQVGFLDAEALGLYDKPMLPDDTLLSETENVKMYLANGQECLAQNPFYNGMTQFIVNGEKIDLVSGIGGTINPTSVNLSYDPVNGGCQYHLTVNKDGWVIIPSKVSSNKPYYVYEGNFIGQMNLMAYTLGMEIDNPDYSNFTHGVYTLPATESGYFDFNSTDVDNYTFGGTSLAWPIRIFTQNPDAYSAGFGTGAIMFPVYADACDYYVFCTGSKLNTCGFIFVEGDPKGEAPSLTVYGPQRIMDGEIYPEKSFEIVRTVLNPGPDDPKPVEPKSITLSLEMQVNSTMQFTALINPEDATATWTTTDSNIITVTETGAVTAHAEGTASVVASTSNNLTASLEIKVVPATAPGIILVKSINLNPDVIYEEEGTQVQLNATVLPDDASDKSLVWSSTNPAVATVDQNGLVSIIAAGTAVVKASATDGSGVVGFCDVTGVDEFTSIPTVTADELENQDVYSIDGRLMIRQASLTELSRLAPGIYIIGERKVAIR